MHIQKIVCPHCSGPAAVNVLDEGLSCSPCQNCGKHIDVTVHYGKVTGIERCSKNIATSTGQLSSAVRGFLSGG